MRFWQLGIEMRPFHHHLWAYGIYGGIGASFGYWLQDVEDKQNRYLRQTRDRLLEKRRRRAEREGGTNTGTPFQKEHEGIMASTAPQVDVVDPEVGTENTAALQ